MTSSAPSGIAKTFVDHQAAFGLLTLLVLFAGIAAVSTPLVILSSIMAFGRPFLYAYLIGSQPEEEISVSTESGKPVSVRFLNDEASYKGTLTAVSGTYGRAFS